MPIGTRWPVIEERRTELHPVKESHAVCGMADGDEGPLNRRDLLLADGERGQIERDCAEQMADVKTSAPAAWAFVERRNGQAGAAGTPPPS